ncbi:peptidase inhibitor family I36 protein [Micromonospora sp. ALFpr18c]|uniref:peptidase inhibitor family I36 protein n=1 Tax=Micromonospora sp. ALFpr18c TaxID=1458665 RepID=UPI001788B3FB|nr:peptidase inhibitor family I36 protein [Micromonospora sp. ALFpr18c]
MKVRKVIIRSAVLAMLGTATSLVAATPALATSHNGSCETGEVCLYNNSSYSGDHDDNYDNDANYQGNTYYNSSTSLNDTVSSAENNAAWQDVHLHSAANYVGAELQIDTQSGWSKLSDYQFDNIASSHDF